ncbi:MAG: TIM barrel protein [Gemmataceae bacterium]|nr:sugar phosphate isomerase/epimerase [Gemmata sp.]MDW8199071.1 TIM barrel protein [Gemmataceae bacterium]
MTHLSFLLGWVTTLLLVLGSQPTPPQKAPPKAVELYARDNLVAWCIVPFDAKKRTPAQRVAMLQELGFKKYAYDWRSEHLPTFDEEIRLLKEANIELTAVWFPAQLNKDAEVILAAIKKHEVKPQLWVTLSDPTPTTPTEKVTTAAQTIEPIATAAAKLGCSVGLYNHGGWFGEPENQIAIIESLKLKNIGIVYNLHHGHEQFDRFPEILKKMHPYLYAININGCVKDGHKMGKKIMPVGSGELDLKFLSAIRDIGYTGPIGILGHTHDDVAERLADNLDGLAWLVRQLNGQPPGEKPRYRTLPPP